jgi:hypothetical protein
MTDPEALAKFIGELCDLVASAPLSPDTMVSILVRTAADVAVEHGISDGEIEARLATFHHQAVAEALAARTAN